MKKNIKATSIVEALVIMLIVVMGIVGMYNIFLRSKALSVSTWNRIVAIQIAREWVEALTNIRNTNTLLFSADLENCWNTLNYDINCISNTGTGTDIQNNTSFVVYKDIDNRWKLQEETSSWTGYRDSNYRDNFRVNFDWDGLYTQSWGINFAPLFTREILINYEDTDGDMTPTSNDEKMNVASIVRWGDSSSSEPYEIRLDLLLSNWEGGD